MDNVKLDELHGLRPINHGLNHAKECVNINGFWDTSYSLLQNYYFPADAAMAEFFSASDPLLAISATADPACMV